MQKIYLFNLFHLFYLNRALCIVLTASIQKVERIDEVPTEETVPSSEEQPPPESDIQP